MRKVRASFRTYVVVLAIECVLMCLWWFLIVLVFYMHMCPMGPIRANKQPGGRAGSGGARERGGQAGEPGILC
jgi:hypothetical protein